VPEYPQADEETHAICGRPRECRAMASHKRRAFAKDSLGVTSGRLAAVRLVIGLHFSDQAAKRDDLFF
jgi:hypothetical protein